MDQYSIFAMVILLTLQYPSPLFGDSTFWTNLTGCGSCKGRCGPLAEDDWSVGVIAKDAMDNA